MYTQCFILLCLFRYVRLIVNCLANWTFKPIPIPRNPQYTPRDVTAVLPTINSDGDDPEELRNTLKSMLLTEVYEIIVVGIDDNKKRLQSLIESLDTRRVKLLSVPKPNKRVQLCQGIPEVTTKITILVDDDVTWPAKFLEWILAPFEDPKMGGSGTCQRLRRSEKRNIWSFLGALYLERRNFEIAATTHMDGGVSCMSGRSVAYRTHILQDEAFRWGFTNEKFIGLWHLNADDDNFVTRWMVSHGWKTYIQYTEEAELKTTLEDNPKFLKQCLRWSRSNWRSNLTSMLMERYIWRQQPWCSYALHLATLSPPAFFGDPLLFFLLWNASFSWDQSNRQYAFVALGAMMFISKFIKTIGHYYRYPQDIVLLPVAILFGWFHGFIKIYAFFTLDVTAWGSREGADIDDTSRMVLLRSNQRRDLLDIKEKMPLDESTPQIANLCEQSKQESK